ncbi:3-oxoacyl-ACP reductase [Chelatococcus reniformis]|uniref:3-oxoacyl-ACP reductase n=2 Tax=Chelatococcus reniformis TaxID=1494448 RepID=A0A916XDC3_9HYPH|nr:3-oxoacyl-ACP reductase [Chelatococcus reniformis]
MQGAGGGSTQVAVVTGGASGLGLAAVRKLLERGFAVAIWDHSAAALERTTAALAAAGPVLACRVDVSDVNSVERASQRTRAELGDPAALVAAAAVPGPVVPFADYALDDWQRVLDINLTGVHLTCRALVPAMVQAGWGRVVIVSSVAGKEGNALQSAYVASKAGVIGYVKCLGKELATSGVLVNSIAPTVFDTPMLRQTSDADPSMIAAMQAKVPMGRLGQPDEFGEMAAWLCSGACSFTTGMTFDLSGGRSTY